MKKSLGLVEVQGLALAITTADAMMKSANVVLLGTERANGNGWTIIKVAGDVGAVNAAVSAGCAHASQSDGLCGSKVIARPSDDVSEQWGKEPQTTIEQAAPAENSEAPVAIPQAAADRTSEPEFTNNPPTPETRGKKKRKKSQSGGGDQP